VFETPAFEPPALEATKAEPGEESEPASVVEAEPDPASAAAPRDEARSDPAPEPLPSAEAWRDPLPAADPEAQPDRFAVPSAPPPWEQATAPSWTGAAPTTRSESGAAFADYDLDEPPRSPSWRRIAWIAVPAVLVVATAAYLVQDRYLAADEPLDIGPTADWTASLRDDETAPLPADAGAGTGAGTAGLDAAAGGAPATAPAAGGGGTATAEGRDPRRLQVGDVVEPEPEPASDPARRVEDITWSSHPGGITFLVWTDGALSPDRWLDFPIGGANPRHVIRILGIEHPYPGGTLEVGGAQVTQVRTGLHTDRRPSELHLVLDLASPNATVRSIEAVGSRLRIEVTDGGTVRGGG
jgi:hypothetical protein